MKREPYLLERFSIDKLIAECIKLDWLGMFVRCQNAAMLSEATKLPIKLKFLNELRTAFSNFVHELCYILTKANKAVIPEGMSTENFLKIKPLIARLVSKHEIKEDWLRLY